jgi:hypothetical protein
MQKSNKGSALALALSMASGLGLNGQIARAILGKPMKPMRKPRGSGVQTEHDIARLDAAKAKRLRRKVRNESHL